MEGKVLTLKAAKLYKIDPNKIKTLDDVIQILRRVHLHVNEEGLKGMEHLIVEDDE
ncbi:hypothetical protein [Bacillus cereus]|uniref:hypothetical protein n=1 Tax=Bacillus cereus TaxID=1396 RepID=UPI0015C2E41F|nr:hypothetical protein [Bacillus cereus]